jgi:dihydrofolate synthase / folylpolyglutamate synthase
VLDGAHNIGGAQALVTALVDAFQFDVLVGVVGLLEDKDAHAILGVLEPAFSSIVITQSASPRARSADDLAAVAVEVFGPDRVEVAPRLDDAIDAAVRLVEEEAERGGGGVVVTGSLTVVGEARQLLAH